MGSHTQSENSEPEAATSSKRRRKRRFGLALALAGALVEALAIRRRGYGVAGNVVVRCREGHLFTTLWIPGGSLKSVRLGWARFQRCPVGRHWSLVVPVARDDLNDYERRSALEHHDVRIP